MKLNHSKKPRKVLVVDDDAIIRDMVNFETRRVSRATTPPKVSARVHQGEDEPRPYNIR